MGSMGTRDKSNGKREWRASRGKMHCSRFSLPSRVRSSLLGAAVHRSFRPLVAD